MDYLLWNGCDVMSREGSNKNIIKIGGQFHGGRGGGQPVLLKLLVWTKKNICDPPSPPKKYIVKK